jgi:hypothetical protein
MGLPSRYSLRNKVVVISEDPVLGWHGSGFARRGAYLALWRAIRRAGRAATDGFILAREFQPGPVM